MNTKYIVIWVLFSSSLLVSAEESSVPKISLPAKIFLLGSKEKNLYADQSEQKPRVKSIKVEGAIRSPESCADLYIDSSVREHLSTETHFALLKEALNADKGYGVHIFRMPGRVDYPTYWIVAANSRATSSFMFKEKPVATYFFDQQQQAFIEHIQE